MTSQRRTRMTALEDRPALEVPARVVPVPTSVSPEAQAFLAMGPMEAAEYPALDDVDGWRTMITATDEMVLTMFTDSGLMSPEGFDVDEISVDGVTVYVVTPPDLDPRDRRGSLDPRGGAIVV